MPARVREGGKRLVNQALKQILILGNQLIFRISGRKQTLTPVPEGVENENAMLLAQLRE